MFTISNLKCSITALPRKFCTQVTAITQPHSSPNLFPQAKAKSQSTVARPVFADPGNISPVFADPDKISSGNLQVLAKSAPFLQIQTKSAQGFCRSGQNQLRVGERHPLNWQCPSLLLSSTPNNFQLQLTILGAEQHPR